MKKLFHFLVVPVFLMAGMDAAAKPASKAGFMDVTDIAGEFMDAQPVLIGEEGSPLKDNALLDFGTLPSGRIFKVPGRDGETGRAARGFSERFIVVTPALMAFRDYKIPELDAYVRTMTNDVHARTVMGVRLFQDGRLDESLEVLRRALSINPLEERTAELHSGILMQQPDAPLPAWVADEIHRLLDAHPGNNVIRFNLACAFARSGQVEAALAQLDVLLRSGWPELVYHITDRDFESLREDAGFVALQNRLLETYRESLNRYLLGTLRAPALAP
jgi:hypothetical protein